MGAKWPIIVSLAVFAAAAGVGGGLLSAGLWHQDSQTLGSIRAACSFTDPGGVPDQDDDSVCDSFDNCPQTPNPEQEDVDGDLVGDSCDNCPGWSNPGQALPPWTIPPGDPDCDGFDDTVENFVGTQPSVQCASDTTTNNEDPDPWPADFDDDQDSDIFDMMSFKSHFGSPTSAPYSARHDLHGQDGDTDIFDVLVVKRFYNLSCG